VTQNLYSNDKNLTSEPWRALPSGIADVFEPELEATTEEILASIGREVPEYARPLEGRFGRGLRTGVTEALSQFLALVRDPEAGRGTGRDVYVELGRGEQRQGRTLDSLQAAYRVGARIAWRRLALAGRRAGLEADVLILLAEAIFAYIDELSADSVEGYAEEQAEREDDRRRRRRELVALLVREPPAEEADVRAMAQAAGWPLPRTVAALACAADDVGAISRCLPAESLATTLEDLGCVLVPDPAGPGRGAALERAARRGSAALGPGVAPSELHLSWSLALRTLRAAQAGVLPGVGLRLAERHLAALLLFEGEDLTRRMAARRLAPLKTLTPRARERMRETALAYVRHQGSPTAMAAALHVHSQTARYRTARLRELLGDQLDDPDARFELELALRAEALAP
jgi:PucR C-terminal helix-turn-helix domain